MATLTGCTVGPLKVAVSAIPPGETSSNPAPSFNPNPNISVAELQDASKKMADATQSSRASPGSRKTKSFIPEKCKDVATSGTDVHC